MCLTHMGFEINKPYSSLIVIPTSASGARGAPCALVLTTKYQCMTKLILKECNTYTPWSP